MYTSFDTHACDLENAPVTVIQPIIVFELFHSAQNSKFSIRSYIILAFFLA